jgi:hypothetical protein
VVGTHLAPINDKTCAWQLFVSVSAGDMSSRIAGI